ncbi:hypothetical protein MMC11_006076 [Xylographa trunciseda]|nr:hypothetical protein [Xylographa trunciseda]
MTADGVKYEVGQPKPKEETDAEVMVKSHGPSFNVPVYWVPGGNWQDTSPDFANEIGITRWKITNTGIIWTYELFFDTNQTYNCTFTDKTGQGYGNNAFQTGVHSVNYNSDSPTIVQASGI